MRRFTIDLDGPLHGVDYGGDGQLVLLVHGLGGSSINWAEVGEDLTSHGRVLAPDLPGFGRTPPAGRSASIQDQAALLANWLERETDDPAIVIGNSMGGIISMLLAARQPHLVDRLIGNTRPALDLSGFGRHETNALCLQCGQGGLVVGAIKLVHALEHRAHLHGRHDQHHAE